MRVKKYPQAHLVISSGVSKIVIDPGMLTFAQGTKPEEFSDAQAFLFTHNHPDHLDPQTVKAVVGNKPVFGNADVVKTLSDMGVAATEVKDGDKFKAGDFEITAIDLPHCAMQDGSAVPLNTGFLVNGILFHPGDGDIAPKDLKVANIALPIAGPTINLDGALKFALNVGAKVAIPIHNDYFKNDPIKFKEMASANGIETRDISAGEETEVG